MKKRKKTLKKNAAHLKLNMELKGNQQKIKEETTMRKQRNYVAMAMAIAMVMAVLTACGTEPQQQPVVTTTPAPTVVEAKPTEAPVATEAPEPTEEPTPTEAPTEAPTPTVSPYVMGDIDFTEYYNEGKIWHEVVQESECNSIRVIVLTYDGVEAVLKDGDSYEMDKEKQGYTFFVYAPKKVTSFDKTDEMWDYLNTKSVSDRYEKIPYSFKPDDNFFIDGMDISIIFTYEDGSQETATINLTKTYTL